MHDCSAKRHQRLGVISSCQPTFLNFFASCSWHELMTHCLWLPPAARSSFLRRSSLCCKLCSWKWLKRNRTDKHGDQEASNPSPFLRTILDFVHSRRLHHLKPPLEGSQLEPQQRSACCWPSQLKFVSSFTLQNTWKLTVYFHRFHLKSEDAAPWNCFSTHQHFNFPVFWGNFPDD